MSSTADTDVTWAREAAGVLRRGGYPADEEVAVSVDVVRAVSWLSCA